MTDFYEDACYLSTSEPEPDSEVEELDDDVNHDSRRSNGKAATKGSSAPSSEALQWEDPQALLNTWLGELDSLKVVSGSIYWLSLLESRVVPLGPAFRRPPHIKMTRDAERGVRIRRSAFSLMFDPGPRLTSAVV